MTCMTVIILTASILNSELLEGVLYKTNNESGLSEQRMSVAIVKLINMMSNDCFKEMINPRAWDNIQFINELPSTVRKISRGNFIAIKIPCNGDRHNPIVNPYIPPHKAIVNTQRMSQ